MKEVQNNFTHYSKIKTMENKTIQQRAEEYAGSNYVWPKNKKGETVTQVVGQKNPPFYKKQTQPMIKAYTTGATEQAAIMQPEIDRLQERVKELEEGFEAIYNSPFPFNYREYISWAETARSTAKQLLTKTQTP